MSNNNLHQSKRNKNDEYYTRYNDIAEEVKHYQSSFRNKIVYCNCDDRFSNFRRFFIEQFHELGLKRLYCTGISGYCLEYDGLEIKEGSISDGDFRSAKCVDILKASDICVTNPPFSLFRKYFSLLKKYGKDYLIIGNKNAMGYSEVFPSIKNNTCKIGYTIPNSFISPNGSIVKLTGLCRWFTSFSIKKKVVKPSAIYSNAKYECFDLYPAINVDRMSDIPCDYSGLMGVPITFLEKIDRNSFCIVDLIARYAICNPSYNTPGHQLTEIKGRPKYTRVIIKSLQ